MSTADLQAVINGIEGLAAIAAVWSLVHFGKVKLSSPTKTGNGTTAAAKNAAAEAKTPAEPAKPGPVPLEKVS